jgi:DNA-binding MarR family transcriptional regulator
MAAARAKPNADDDEIALALQTVQLAQEITRAYGTHVHGRYGLTIARLGLLLLIDRSPRPPRPADLAFRIGCSRVTVTRLLHGLERSGLIVRRRDPDDGRAQRIALTPASGRVLRELRPRHEQRLRALLWHASDADRRDLVRIAERLRAGLRKLDGA